MKAGQLIIYLLLSGLALGCRPPSTPPRAQSEIQPFEVRVSESRNGFHTVASLNVDAIEARALAKALDSQGIEAVMETGIVCEVFAKAEAHPKVVRFLSSHREFREKVLSYYAIQPEIK